MKDIMKQAENKVNIIGKLLSTTFRTGTTKTGQPYEGANVVVQVKQTYGGKEETSEITVSMFATPFTTKGTPSPAYKSIQDLKGMNTAQNVGFDDAAIVRLTGGSLSENAFVTKSGQVVDSWQIRSSFVNTVASSETVATFVAEIFIMDMHPELDRDGDSTGRLVIKGGLVQYGGKLDVIEFIVEDPESADYIERNWNINDTVTAKGRIRVTSIEEKSSGSESSWGEDIPEATTRFVKELIITRGSDEGQDEDFAYDPVDIKKAFNVRKANLEQLQTDAKNAPAAKKAAAPSGNKYSWE
jgi:hypothetical protein